MASRNRNARKCFTFQWKIKNSDHLWQKRQERVESSSFVVDEIEGTKWRLWLYPRGLQTENISTENAALFLVRDADVSGAEYVEIEYKLAFMKNFDRVAASSGLIKERFHKDHRSVERQSAVFLERRSEFLSHWIICQCQIWKSVGEVSENIVCEVHSKIEVDRIATAWKIGKPGSGKKIKREIKSSRAGHPLISLELLTGRLDEEIGFNITQMDQNLKSCSLRVFLADASGKMKKCFTNLLMFDVPGETQKAKEYLVKTKLSKPLSFDVLHLKCGFCYGMVEGEYTIRSSDIPINFDSDDLSSSSCSNSSLDSCSSDDADEGNEVAAIVRRFHDAISSAENEKRNDNSETCHSSSDSNSSSSDSESDSDTSSSSDTHDDNLGTVNATKLPDSLSSAKNDQRNDDNSENRPSACSASSSSFYAFWKIKNASYCWQKQKEWLESPPFVVDEIEGTKWKLWLFPRGIVTKTFKTNNIVLSLVRDEDSKGPEYVDIKYVLSLTKENGDILEASGIRKARFHKDHRFTAYSAETFMHVFDGTMSTFMSKDKIHCSCMLSKSVGEHSLGMICGLLTRIVVVDSTMTLWKMGGFNPLESEKVFKHEIKSLMSGHPLISLELSTGTLNSEEIRFKIIQMDQKLKSCSLQLFLVDAPGKFRFEFLKEVFTFDAPGETKIAKQYLVKSKVMNNKPKYLPNDVLSLMCVCGFCYGAVVEQNSYGGRSLTEIIDADTEDQPPSSSVPSSSQHPLLSSEEYKAQVMTYLAKHPGKASNKLKTIVSAWDDKTDLKKWKDLRFILLSDASGSREGIADASALLLAARVRRSVENKRRKDADSEDQPPSSSVPSSSQHPLLSSEEYKAQVLAYIAKQPGKESKELHDILSTIGDELDWKDLSVNIPALVSCPNEDIAIAAAGARRSTENDPEAPPSSSEHPILSSEEYKALVMAYLDEHPDEDSEFIQMIVSACGDAINPEQWKGCWDIIRSNASA